MDADPLSVSLWRPIPQCQVGATQRLEQRQQLVAAFRRCMQPIDPQVLVVAHQIGLVVGQDPPVSAGSDHLGIHDVSDALEGRPLPRLWAAVKIWTGFGDKVANALRSCGLDLGGVIGPNQADQMILVCLWLCDWIGAAIVLHKCRLARGPLAREHGVHKLVRPRALDERVLAKMRLLSHAKPLHQRG